VFLSLAVIATPVLGQETAQSEREAMYYRYLEFASYVKGGSIQPHWMADGSSFWYAEGGPETREAGGTWLRTTPYTRPCQERTSTSWACPGSRRTDLNSPNRRVRTRMPGGVGGENC
jgi:hypothetical protein